MNYIKITLIFFLLFSCSPNKALATVKTQSEVSQNQFSERDNAIKKVSKKHNRFIQKLKRGDIDLNHPIKKWLWLTLLFFLVSVIFRAFGFGSFAYILGAVALVCLLIWLLKIAGAL
jgi:hypothetical protein